MRWPVRSKQASGTIRMSGATSAASGVGSRMPHWPLASGAPKCQARMISGCPRPAIAGRGHPLIMRAWHFGAPLASGQWGIREPTPEAAEVAPDILIVPLACFDRTGHRIGYGAGYYDMTINALRAKKPTLAIGIAFAAQEIPKVPATERDAPLDLVLTEREIIDFRR